MPRQASPADQPTPRPAKRTSGPTRERLLAGAREAFAIRGFASTRVADIVALAGTSHGTFYTYFDDKRDALLALTQTAASAVYGAAVAPLAAGHPESAREAIRTRMALFFGTYSEWWDVVRTWDHASAIHPEVDELRARIRGSIVEQLCHVLAHEREHGQVDRGLDLEITAIALTAMVEEFASRWLALGRTVGTTEIDQLTALCAGAVSNQHRQPG
ncbi:MAG: TetR/AcrR family transcriptional regulator [Solirubrobacteraceae bacterium]|jgi:AcrR family transcriptional regulator